MRTLLLITGLVALTSLALAAPSYTRAQALALCEDAAPVPNPDWQDFFGFKATGDLKMKAGQWTIRGIVFGEAGTCVFGKGLKYPEFRLDDPVGAKRRTADADNRANFASKCYDAVDIKAGIQAGEGTGWASFNDHGQPSLKGKLYTFTGDLLGEQYTCTGTLAGPITMTFLHPESPLKLQRALKTFLATRAAKTSPVVTTPLLLMSGKCQTSTTYTRLFGEVKNTSTTTLNNIMAVATIHDSAGLLGSDEALLTFKVLRPQETSPFEVLVDTGGRNGDCTLDFKTIDGQRVAWSTAH